MEYIKMGAVVDRSTSTNANDGSTTTNANAVDSTTTNANAVDSSKTTTSRKGILEMINDYDQDDYDHSINDDDYTNIDDDDSDDGVIDDEDYLAYNDADNYVEEGDDDNNDNDNGNDGNDNINIDDIYVDNDDSNNDKNDASNNDNDASFISCAETLLLGNNDTNDDDDNINSIIGDTTNTNYDADDSFIAYDNDDATTAINRRLQSNDLNNDPFIDISATSSSGTTTIESAITKHNDDYHTTNTTNTTTATTATTDNNNQSGYQYSLFKTPPHDSMLCPICLKVLHDPVNCLQGHSFCRYCITDMIKGSSNPFCPMDRQPLEIDRLAGNLALKNIILSLDVLCQEIAKDTNTSSTSTDENDNKCTWSGPLNSLHNHHIDCQYKIVSCTSLDCFYQGPRMYMTKHKETCDNRLTVCRCCSKVGQYKHRNLHIAYCSHWKFMCENGCSKKVSRSEKKNHLDKECPLSKVICPFYRYGCECEGFMLRKDLPLHLLDARNLKLIIPALLTRVETDAIKIKKLEDQLKEVVISNKNTYVSLLLKVPYGSDMMNMMSYSKVDDTIVITSLNRYLLPKASATEYLAHFVTEEWSVFEESGAMVNDIITRVENTKTGVIVNVNNDTTMKELNKAFEYTGKKCVTLLMTIKRQLE